MQYSRYRKYDNEQHNEYDIRWRPTLKHKVDSRTHEYNHHDDSVEGAEHGGDDELVRRLHDEADNYKSWRRNNCETVRPIEADSEHGVVSTGCHQQHGGGSKNRRGKHQELVQQVKSTDVVVNLQNRNKN